MGSRDSSVSTDLHMWHVTYSEMYLRSKDSIYFGWYLPLISMRSAPSMLPVVPSSFKKNDCAHWQVWTEAWSGYCGISTATVRERQRSSRRIPPPPNALPHENAMNAKGTQSQHEHPHSSR